ncbi:MAG: hypothetical protein ACTINL_16845, partial [Serratia proteamaculans]
KKPSPCKVWNISLIGYCIGISIWKGKKGLSQIPARRPNGRNCIKFYPPLGGQPISPAIGFI